MSAPSWPLWGGSEIMFWTDDRGWAADHAGRHYDSFALIEAGLPTLDAAHAVAARYLARHGLRRVEVVSGGEA
jgi:hypothetical protein